MAEYERDIKDEKELAEKGRKKEEKLIKMLTAYAQAKKKRDLNPTAKLTDAEERALKANSEEVSWIKYTYNIAINKIILSLYGPYIFLSL